MTLMHAAPSRLTSRQASVFDSKQPAALPDFMHMAHSSKRGHVKSYVNQFADDFRELCEPPRQSKPHRSKLAKCLEYFLCTGRGRNLSPAHMPVWEASRDVNEYSFAWCSGANRCRTEAEGCPGCRRQSKRSLTDRCEVLHVSGF